MSSDHCTWASLDHCVLATRLKNLKSKMIFMKYCWIVILCFHLAFQDVFASISSDCLEQHNHYRSRYHVPDVTYSVELEQRAQSLAAYMARANAQLEYIQGNVDENLFHGASRLAMTISDALKHWSRGSRSYNYKHPHSNFKNSNFIKLVWKSYKKIGCGYALVNKEDGTIGTYVVTLYEPQAPRPVTTKDLLANVLAPKPHH